MLLRRVVRPCKCLWNHTHLHKRRMSLQDNNYCRVQNNSSVLNTAPHQFVPATRLQHNSNVLLPSGNAVHLNTSKCYVFIFHKNMLHGLRSQLAQHHQYHFLSRTLMFVWWMRHIFLIHCHGFFTAVKCLDTRHGPWPLFFPSGGVRRNVSFKTKQAVLEAAARTWEAQGW